MIGIHWYGGSGSVGTMTLLDQSSGCWSPSRITEFSVKTQYSMSASVLRKTGPASSWHSSSRWKCVRAGASGVFMSTLLTGHVAVGWFWIMTSFRTAENERDYKHARLAYYDSPLSI